MERRVSIAISRLPTNLSTAIVDKKNTESCCVTNVILGLPNDNAGSVPGCLRVRRPSTGAGLQSSPARDTARAGLPPRDVIFGNGRHLTLSEVFFTAGIAASLESLRHQEAIGRDAQRGVMVSTPNRNVRFSAK